MNQDNNTLESKKFKHLTLKNRYRIEILLKEGLKVDEIAERMKKGKRTIEREIAKGTIKF